jgi:type IV secretion system protein VirB5
MPSTNLVSLRNHHHLPVQCLEARLDGAKHLVDRWRTPLLVRFRQTRFTAETPSNEYVPKPKEIEMNRYFSYAFIAGLVLASANAEAQMMVLDGANLVQSMNQVAAWKKQYDQMLQQQEQLRAQHAAMTGNRGIGALANNPLLRQVVPDNVLQTYQAIQSNGAVSLTPAARALRNSSRLYDCEGRTGDDWRTCQAWLNNAAQQQAYQQNATAMLDQRFIQIESLQKQINATSDPKSIAELQARLQVEATQVANDANRLMILQSMSASADRAAQQAIKERELRNLSLTGDGSDTFVYKPYKK